MNSPSDLKFLRGLLEELRKFPAETPWVEFKHNKAVPEEIGEYLSALSNAAALDGKTNAYLVWGVADASHEVVGTTFDPLTAKQGNEDLENWLVRLLNPRLHFKFHQFDYEGSPVVILEIPRASGKPTSFGGNEFIRVGSYRQKLKDHPLCQLPAPSFETPEESTRSVLFAHKSLNDMDGNDRIRARYLHAALRHVERDPMTNTTLRERFGIEKRNSATASRIIKETLDSKRIRPSTLSKENETQNTSRFGREKFI